MISLRTRSRVVSKETLEDIERRHSARLDRDPARYWNRSRRSRTLLQRNENMQVRSVADDVEGRLNANVLTPIFRTFKTSFHIHIPDVHYPNG